MTGEQQRRGLDPSTADCGCAVRYHLLHVCRNQSNHRERLYAKRRKLHARVVNVRNDNHHKATTAIAKSSGRVVVETLNVSGMVRNRRLSRAISDAGMAGFLTKLEYKCGWYGAEFVKADRWFAFVEVVRSLRLEEREHDPFRSGVVVRRLWSVERTRLQRCGEFRELAGFELPGVRTWRACKTGYAGGGR